MLVDTKISYSELLQLSEKFSIEIIAEDGKVKVKLRTLGNYFEENGL